MSGPWSKQSLIFCNVAGESDGNKKNLRYLVQLKRTYKYL